jgi:hypothetical protein
MVLKRASLRRRSAHCGVCTGPATTIKPPARSAIHCSNAWICTRSNSVQSGSKATIAIVFGQLLDVGRKLENQIVGFLRDSRPARLQEHVDHRVAVAVQIRPQELVLARWTTGQDQHPRTPLDDLDIRRLGIIQRVVISRRRLDGQLVGAAPRLVGLDVELDGDDLAVFAQRDHLFGFDRFAPLLVGRPVGYDVSRASIVRPL